MWWRLENNELINLDHYISITVCSSEKWEVRAYQPTGAYVVLRSFSKQNDALLELNSIHSRLNGHKED
jgi:hypothetical protein